MKVVRHTLKTKNKIEQSEIMLRLHCVINNIKLSDTELTILAYFVVYGLSDTTKKLILESKILNSQSSLDNTLSKLRKMKLLVKSSSTFKDILNPLVNINDPVVGFSVKLDNRQ